MRLEVDEHEAARVDVVDGVAEPLEDVLALDGRQLAMCEHLGEREAPSIEHDRGRRLLVVVCVEHRHDKVGAERAQQLRLSREVGARGVHLDGDRRARLEVVAEDDARRAADVRLARQPIARAVHLARDHEVGARLGRTGHAATIGAISPVNANTRPVAAAARAAAIRRRHLLSRAQARAGG